jgi:hypothetical protein
MGFGVNGAFNKLKKTREMILVGAPGFEPGASCAQGSCKKSILLVRLALFYVMVHGFGPNSAVVGPKLDPSLGREKEWDSLAGCSGNQRTIWSYE